MAGRLTRLPSSSWSRRSGNFGVSFLGAGAFPPPAPRREVVMKEILHTMIAAAALALAQAAPASAGVNNPEKIISRFVGAADNGGAAGRRMSSAMVYTNLSGHTE